VPGDARITVYQVEPGAWLDAAYGVLWGAAWLLWALRRWACVCFLATLAAGCAMPEVMRWLVEVTRITP